MTAEPMRGCHSPICVLPGIIITPRIPTILSIYPVGPRQKVRWTVLRATTIAQRFMLQVYQTARSVWHLRSWHHFEHITLHGAFAQQRRDS